MAENNLVAIAVVLVLGVFAQLFAWRLKLPSILILLIFGFFSGPGMLGIVQPDSLLGDLLFPIVSLSVAVILFEGGLSLRLREIPTVKTAIFGLISVGMVITWITVGLAAYYVLELETGLAVLLGAILTVSGPTVVLPLIRHIRPRAPLGEILKWEGILIDPVGALAAVLTYEVLIHYDEGAVGLVALKALGLPVVVGSITGVLGALVMANLFRRHAIPDYLQNPFSLMMVVGIHAVSNSLAHESGLLATTLLGVVLANSKGVAVKHILEFKENLVILLLSTLFILLAARVDMEMLSQISAFRMGLFLFLLIVVCRPLAVFASTFGAQLSLRERMFLAWMAPRGIVAAAVASLFSLELSHNGFVDAHLLVPYTFLVIVGTVIIYGLTGDRVALWLGARQARTDGVLFLGAQALSRGLAKVLQNEGFSVFLYDTNYSNVSQAKLDGLPAIHANLLGSGGAEDAELEGVGRLLALTPNHEVNSLATIRLSERFGNAEVYQLAEKKRQKALEADGEEDVEYGGRTLFGQIYDYAALQDFCDDGAVIKVTGLTPEFSYNDFLSFYGDRFIPLCLLKEDNTLEFFTTDRDLQPGDGSKLITLVAEESLNATERVRPGTGAADKKASDYSKKE